MSKGVTLLGTTYKTKKAAEDFVRSQLHAFDESSPLWPELLSLHPEREEKIGPGILRFYVSPNPLNWKALQLNIERVDGSCVDISWKTCVSGRAKTPRDNLRAAMRRAVDDQIQRFKGATHQDGALCMACGILLPEKHLCHADHHPKTFDSLAEEFLLLAAQPPVTFDDCPRTHAPVFRAEDMAFSTEWESFHAARAELRLVCRTCNLTKKR
jgi:hypothetical protein